MKNLSGKLNLLEITFQLQKLKSIGLAPDSSLLIPFFYFNKPITFCQAHLIFLSHYFYRLHSIPLFYVGLAA